MSNWSKAVLVMPAPRRCVLRPKAGRTTLEKGWNVDATFHLIRVMSGAGSA
jgi:hypothetical protein